MQEVNALFVSVAILTSVRVHARGMPITSF